MTKITDRLAKLKNKTSELEGELTRKTQGIFTFKRACDTVKEQKDAPPARQIFGSYIHEGELSIVFAESNVGKSIVAVQVCDGIARGSSFIAGMRCEVEGQPVIYYDLELMSRQFAGRYTDRTTGMHHEFHPNLIRPEVTPPDIEEGYAKSIELYAIAIRDFTRATGVKIIVIDNLSVIAGDLTEGKTALRLMAALKVMKMEGITIIAITHPKKGINLNEWGITADDMIGSSMVRNMVDSIFAVGQNAANEDVVYMKQLKVREGEKQHDVAVFERVKESAFLQFKFKEMTSESKQLKKLHADDDQTLNDVIWALYQNEPNIRHSEIVKSINDSGQFSVKFHQTTITRRLKRLQENAQREAESRNESESDEMPF